MLSPAELFYAVFRPAAPSKTEDELADERMTYFTIIALKRKDYMVKLISERAAVQVGIAMLMSKVEDPRNHMVRGKCRHEMVMLHGQNKLLSRRIALAEARDRTLLTGFSHRRKDTWGLLTYEWRPQIGHRRGPLEWRWQRGVQWHIWQSKMLVHQQSLEQDLLQELKCIQLAAKHLALPSIIAFFHMHFARGRWERTLCGREGICRGRGVLGPSPCGYLEILLSFTRTAGIANLMPDSYKKAYESYLEQFREIVMLGRYYTEGQRDSLERCHMMEFQKLRTEEPDGRRWTLPRYAELRGDLRESMRKFQFEHPVDHGDMTWFTDEMAFHPASIAPRVPSELLWSPSWRPHPVEPLFFHWLNTTALDRPDLLCGHPTWNEWGAAWRSMEDWWALVVPRDEDPYYPGDDSHAWELPTQEVQAEQHLLTLTEPF